MKTSGLLTCTLHVYHCSTQSVLAMSLSNACCWKCSVAQTNFYKSQKFPAFFVGYQACLLYTFSVGQCSCGKSLFPSFYRFVFVVFVVVVLANVQFSFAVLPAILVSSLFPWQPSFPNVVENFYRSFYR